MPSIRLRKESHETLSRLAEETGESQTTLVEQAIELLEEALFYRRMSEAYADPEAVDLAQREASDWDATLTDGLDQFD
jgi:predicted DNA-binding protein